MKGPPLFTRGEQAAGTHFRDVAFCACASASFRVRPPNLPPIVSRERGARQRRKKCRRPGTGTRALIATCTSRSVGAV